MRCKGMMKSVEKAQPKYVHTQTPQHKPNIIQYNDDRAETRNPTFQRVRR